MKLGILKIVVAAAIDVLILVESAKLPINIKTHCPRFHSLFALSCIF